MIVLHRLLEPPVAQLLQRAADADRAPDRVAIVGVEREREVVPHQLADGPRLGDVAGEILVLLRAVAVEADLDRRRFSFRSCSTTRTTSSTVRSPLPPMEA